MAKKKKEGMELRFYEIPQGEAALILIGDTWVRVYGHEETKLHFHNLMEIGICRYGDGEMWLDEEKRQYESGTITVLPQNFPHVTISAGEEPNFWEYIFLDRKQIVRELYPDNPVYQNEIVETLSKGPLMLNRKQQESLGTIIDVIMDEQRIQKTYYRQMVKHYVENLVLEIMRQYSSLDHMGDSQPKQTNMLQIAAALEYISRNYASPIKAGDLADACSMSETHFRRVFEEYINMSPMDYVNLVRIQKACEMMKKTDDSMDIVAVKCGFTTTSTFNRNFKKFLDTSPYQWKINPSTYERRLLNYHITALKGW